MAGTFREWCERTSCHGFAHFIQAASFLGRSLWLVLIVICMCGLGQQLYQIIWGFAISERWTSSVSEVSMHDQRMPKITICNYNRINAEDAQKKGFTPDMIEYFLGHFMNTHVFEQNATKKKESRQAYTKWREERGWTFKEIVEKMSYRCDDVFIFIQSNPVHTMKPGAKMVTHAKAHLSPCEAKIEKDGFEIVSVYTSEFGKCFQIQFGENIVNKFTGGLGTTSIGLHAHVADYLPLIVNNYQDAGFAVQISTDLHSSAVKMGNWIRTPPGYHSWIGIQKRTEVIQETTGIQMHSSPCTESPKMPGLSDEEYDVFGCYYDCGISMIATKCQCYPLVQTDKFRMCELEEYEDCRRELIYDDQTKKAHQDCEKSCVTPCRITGAEISVSTTLYPAPPQIKPFIEKMKQSGRKFESEEVNVSLTAIDVYYTSLNLKMMVTYERTTFDQLLSSIGGQLGLWMGISVLTIEHLVISIFGCISNWKLKKTQTKPQSGLAKSDINK